MVGYMRIKKDMTKIIINKIIRSKRRSIALIVNQDASLIVRVPLKTSLEYIDRLVAKKISWIKEKQALAINNYAKNKPKEFINGEVFLYLGDHYHLKITDMHSNISLIDFLYLPQSMQANAKKCLIMWYKAQALEKLKERVNLYSTMTGLKYKSIKVTGAEKRWGSCSAKGGLCFNWRLIMAPLSILDYVVVHELVHIEEKNHSSSFWGKLRTIMPDYENKRKWLKKNGIMLNI